MTTTTIIDPLDDLIRHLMTGSPREYVYPADTDTRPPRPWALTKSCSNCGEELSRDMFHKDSKNSDGLHSHCKTCRSMAKTPIEQRYIEPVVWFKEAAIVLEGAPILPESVDEARAYLLTTYPEFERDIESTWKRKNKAQRWLEETEDKVLTIDVYHDVTVKLKNVPRVRNKTKGASSWLKGDRRNVSSDVQLLLVKAFEQRVGAKYHKNLPRVITEYQHTNIKTRENNASKLIAGRDLSEDTLFSHIVDNRE